MHFLMGGSYTSGLRICHGKLSPIPTYTSGLRICHNKLSSSPISILALLPHLDQIVLTEDCPIPTQHSWNAVQEMGALPTKNTGHVAKTMLRAGEVA